MAPDPSFGNKKRKRGAQPGNMNALKHGFYSNQFQETEILDLETHMSRGLDSEIAMLRVVMRRLFQLADGNHSMDDMINLTGTIGLSATRLASLLKVQKLLGGDKDAETVSIINKALGDVVKEMRLKI